MNRLKNETSPYLQQHADNPVDWYPWGKKALRAAKEQKKPILLSIGYTACHWCHVMAKEAFEDSETAQIMNELFINIKVDREERPDLDRIYQSALQLLTGRPGGWPLTMFLTPESQVPFFGGTYFPNFKELAKKVSQFYQQQHTDVKKITERIQTTLQVISTTNIDEKVKINDEPLLKAKEQLIAQFDKVNGGFGSAPKFPSTTYLDFLLQQGVLAKKQDKQALGMVILSLVKMTCGGIYDQIGGGFFRYAVDDVWQVPHFEKMLYDNALLLSLFSDVFLVSKNDFFKTIGIEIAEWVINEMQCKEGGYYAAVSSDSEGVEGKYYCWQRSEIRKVLTSQEYLLVEQYFGLTEPANFKNDWHLYVVKNKDIEFKDELIQSAKSKLKSLRKQRIAPEKDTKILVSWNALMIKGMVKAALCFNRVDFLDSAKSAIDFTYKHLWKGKRLLTSYKDAQAKQMACLDDYAFLIDGILLYLESRWDSVYFHFCCELMNVLATHFLDKKGGGFFYTADDHEKLIQRPKSFLDESIPSANAVALQCLLKMGYLLGETSYLKLVGQAFRAAWPQINKMPMGFSSLLDALQMYLNPPTWIIIRGEEKQIQKWQQVYQQDYYPAVFSYSIPSDAKDLPAVLQEKGADKKTQAYICQGTTCQKPIQTLSEFKQRLKSI